MELPFKWQIIKGYNFPIIIENSVCCFYYFLNYYTYSYITLMRNVNPYAIINFQHLHRAIIPRSAACANKSKLYSIFPNSIFICTKREVEFSILATI